MAKKIDLTGQRFGTLTATSFNRIENYISYWNCKCDCGNKSIVKLGNLRNGNTTSCGHCIRSGGSTGVQLTKANIKKEWKEGTDLKHLTSRLNSNNTSGYKGVSWHKKLNKWIVYIKLRYKHIHIGYFDKLEDAVKARKEAEEKYFHPILEKYGRLEETGGE